MANFKTALETLAKANRDLALQPWEQYRGAFTLVRAGKLTEANNLRDSTTTNFANHPQYLKFVSALEKNINKAEQTFSDYQTQKTAAEQLETAQERFDELHLVKRGLARALDQWSDNPSYISEDESLDALITQSKPKEPLTGISLQQAYATWLSERTGKTYRLPTKVSNPERTITVRSLFRIAHQRYWRCPCKFRRLEWLGLRKIISNRELYDANTSYTG